MGLPIAGLVLFLEASQLQYRIKIMISCWSIAPRRTGQAHSCWEILQGSGLLSIFWCRAGMGREEGLEVVVLTGQKDSHLFDRTVKNKDQDYGPKWSSNQVCPRTVRTKAGVGVRRWGGKVHLCDAGFWVRPRKRSAEVRRESLPSVSM